MRTRIVVGSLALVLSALVLPAAAASADRNGTLPNAGGSRSAAGRNRNAQARIIGGTPAGSRYGYFVQGDLGCGGVLVARDVVLSAAHCQNVIADYVIVGNTLKDKVTSGAQKRSIVGEKVVHPGFDYFSFEHDVMLFKIQPVTKSRLRPIPLNLKANVPYNNQVLTTMGFGATSEGGSNSNVLRKVNVQAVPYAECRPLVSSFVLHRPTMFCAGIDGGGYDSCNGDSGGPIIDPVNNVLVGVVSWGDGCARPRDPGVYARISGPQLSWIRSTLCSLTDTEPDFC
jgi:trypsin